MSNLIPNDVEQMHSVKIDYVSSRVEKEDLEKLFGKYGRVGDVYLPSHPNGDRKGFAFVRFYNKQDAEDAVKEMEGYELEGKTLKCMLATVQKSRFNPNVRKSSGRSRSRSRSRSRRGRRDSRSRRRDDAARLWRITEGLRPGLARAYRTRGAVATRELAGDHRGATPGLEGAGTTPETVIDAVKFATAVKVATGTGRRWALGPSSVRSLVYVWELAVRVSEPALRALEPLRVVGD
ncbi:SRSF8 [Symbiodinium microadriaticum]|nr:SRSF8 [Symbiodinium microadriaticum]